MPNHKLAWFSPSMVWMKCNTCKRYAELPTKVFPKKCPGGCLGWLTQAQLPEIPEDQLRPHPHAMSKSELDDAAAALEKTENTVEKEYLADVLAEQLFRTDVVAQASMKDQFTGYCPPPTHVDLAVARTLYHLFAGKGEVMLTGCFAVGAATSEQFVIGFSGPKNKVDSLKGTLTDLVKTLPKELADKVTPAASANVDWQTYLSEWLSHDLQPGAIDEKNCAESKLFGDKAPHKFSGVTVMWLGSQLMRAALAVRDGKQGAGEVMLPCGYCRKSGLLNKFLDDTVKD